MEVLLWDAVDSFANLFDGFYYLFSGESTSKADKFDNLRSMKILNTILLHKRVLGSVLRPLPFNHSRNQNLVLRKSSFGIPASI